MTAEKRSTNSILTALVFAGFAVGCIVAFLVYRGGDIGQLSQLVRNLGGGTNPRFLGIVFILGLMAAYLQSGILALYAMRKRFELILPVQLEFVVLFALGAAIWSVIWFFLGVAGFYTKSVASILVLVALVTGILFERKIRKQRGDEGEEEQEVISIFTARRLKKSNETSRNKTLLEKALIGLIAIPVVLSFIASMAPPIAKDSLLYHFALPKAFIEQGSNAFVVGNIASYLPLGTEMHILSERLLGIDADAGGVLVWLFFPLLVVAVCAWTRELGCSRTWALIGGLIVAAIPTAYHVASSGYIDLSLALYVTLATYSLTRWWKEQTWGWVVLMAIFLGAALSVKLTAVFVFAAFALVVLLRARGEKNPVAIVPGSDTHITSTPGKIVLSGFGALLLAGVIASPWYIRTWAATGAPVFPFYMSIWPGRAEGWDVERSNLFQAMNSQYGGADVNKLNYLTAPVRVSVAAQPEQPANYDGVLGPAFLIGLPLLAFGLWKLDHGVEVKMMAGVAGVMYLFWLFSSEQLRYLLPIVPMLAIAIAASAEKIGGRVAQVAKYGLIAASVCGLLTTFAWFAQKAPLRVVLGGETRDEYLSRNLDYYPYYKWINTETAPDARVWLINMRRDTYHIERPVFSDYLFEDWTLRKMLWETRSVEELRARAAAMNVQYVLTRHDFLFDYDSSTLVDDKRPRSENEAKLRIARDFILDKDRTIKADGKFSLVKVF